MYYLVNVGHKGMAVHLTWSDCEGFYKVLNIQCSGWNCWWYVMPWDWRGREFLGSVREMKALTMKMQTVTLVG